MFFCILWVFLLCFELFIILYKSCRLVDFTFLICGNLLNILIDVLFLLRDFMFILL